jgi:hypothetical protein
MAAGRSGEMVKRRGEQQPGKQDQSGIAVGFEQGKAAVRVGDVELYDLPDKVRGESEQNKR